MARAQVPGDLLLEWVRLRAAGMSTVRIARDYGCSHHRVRTLTNRVKNADLAESGEPEAEVRCAYW